MLITLSFSVIVYTRAVRGYFVNVRSALTTSPLPIYAWWRRPRSYSCCYWPLLVSRWARPV